MPNIVFLHCHYKQQQQQQYKDSLHNYRIFNYNNHPYYHIIFKSLILHNQMELNSTDIDQWITKLTNCETLNETEVKLLCEKGKEILAQEKNV